ncbi:MAG: peptidase M48, partial [Xanthomonadales bacterium]|nr:peptidase M48 [Xanthomonadales bacterium]
DLAKQIHRKQEQAEQRRARAAEQEQAAAGARGPFDAASIIEQIGNPEWERFMMAAAVAAALPEQVNDAAHSADWAPDVLFYTLLDPDPEIRDRQMLIVARRMGSESDERLRSLLANSGPLAAEQRLPVLELALPSIKRHPPEYIERVLRTINELTEVDGRIDVFEYLLARVVSRYLWEASNPHSARNAGRKSLAGLMTEAGLVMAVLARHGHADAGEAQAAFAAGMASLGQPGPQEMPEYDDWIGALDGALDRLDRLKMEHKATLVRALIDTVTADGQVVPEELELLRATCAMLHVPLPMMPAG